MNTATPCDVSAVSWDLPVLSGDFTRCDAAQAFNTAAQLGLVTGALVVFLMAIVAFRGR